MTSTESEPAKRPSHRVWRLGVRARLLLAFLGISGFAGLAATASIYAFHEVGARLDFVETRVPPTLSALELSRSAERIIGVVPALLAAETQPRRDAIQAELTAETRRLDATLAELKRAGALPVDEIEPAVRSLTAHLSALDRLVARRLVASRRIAGLRRALFETNDEIERLLAPWLEVTASEISAIGDVNDEGEATGDEDLGSLIRLQHATQSARRQASAIVEMLAEASTADRAQRVSVIEFQLGLALRDLGETSAGLDTRLRPLFDAQADRLRQFALGPDAIADLRRQELALLDDGEELLAETNALSAQLSAAVDRLGAAAKRDIGSAIHDALLVQDRSARALVALVALSLISSILIVWLYVGRNIVRRLTALADGMLAIAAGGLQTPIESRGGDEIAAMGRAVETFRRNTLERDRLLAEKAQAADRLEDEVRRRTEELARSMDEIRDKSRQLETASTFKSRFLAAASHDLRQPLHALNLFVAQLHDAPDPAERSRLISRVEAAIGAMNELFEALLDMSKLDAGVLKPEVRDFPAGQLLKRLETTFAGVAREKGIRLRVVPSKAWVRSDFTLLERILLNLVSNAIRYTDHGGVVVGCRPRSGRLRFDVCDSGPGIASDQRKSIFAEYHQLSPRPPESSEGLGLGLAIVERLARLLDHAVELESRPGIGSRFSVSVPSGAQGGTRTVGASTWIADPVPGKLIVVIDDDAAALEAMRGILRRWGANVLTAPSAEAAIAQLAGHADPPDLIISDHRLAEGRTGIDAIRDLRRACSSGIPAFLISGDTAPERLSDATACGYRLLHKPLTPMALRAMLNRMLGTRTSGA